MSSCLLDKLPTMDEDECLCSNGSGRFDSVDQLGEDYLCGGQHRSGKRELGLTVLPLPVARDTPSRL